MRSKIFRTNPKPPQFINSRGTVPFNGTLPKTWDINKAYQFFPLAAQALSIRKPVSSVAYRTAADWRTAVLVAAVAAVLVTVASPAGTQTRAVRAPAPVNCID